VEAKYVERDLGDNDIYVWGDGGKKEEKQKTVTHLHYIILDNNSALYLRNHLSLPSVGFFLV